MVFINICLIFIKTKEVSYLLYYLYIYMNFTPRIDEAIKLASRLHRDQTRNDLEKTPYVTHLMAVALLVSSATEDEDVIVAGLMHDSLEDVAGYTCEQLAHDCGERVADIVKHVTEPLDASKSYAEQLPWLARKEAYLAVLKTGGIESALVSAADKIHNTESFMLDARREGEGFTSRFLSSVRNRLWLHEQVLIIVEEKLGKDNVLIKRFTLCTEEFRKLATMEQPLAISH